MLLLISNGICLSQWSEAVQDPNAHFSQIVFVDSLRGYIAATLGVPPNTTGAVFITTDGGKHWTEQEMRGAAGLSSISALGDSLVWASAWEVWHSEDGGHTWQPDTVTDFPFDFVTVQFVDSTRGWVTGNYNDGFEGHDGIFRSTDGGQTWKQQYAQTVEYYSHLSRGYFVDSLHGWVADQDFDHVTSDGGDTWNGQGTGSYILTSIFFVDTLRGWTVGADSYIGRTLDGGVHWLPNYVGSFTRTYTSVFFSDSLNGWVCDDSGGIMRTTDGGASWNSQRPETLPGNHGLNSIFFVNKNDGWAVGNGIVLHTTNGGGVTAVKKPPPVPREFELLQNYPNPFNPTTVIRFVVRSSGFVSLKVYDVLGREVATLVDGSESAGTHSVVFNGSKLASGVYFYRLAAPGINLVRKMLLEK